ncbi:MAG: hypothetical protein LBR97_09415 [Dysgonamonadaceae bacterium]|jgi:hypothetical protein|nr:hypothetical protein [Dysgonamonadaceae bacterium]
MKRKLFTLLLAIVALTAFQANAQQQGSWILADTSGLANNELYSDSFPNNKLGLYNWLSDNGKTFYVHPRVDTTDRYEIYRDEQNKFQLKKVGETNDYRFYIRKESVSGRDFELEWDKKPISQFEIVQFNGTPETRVAQKFVNDTIEGYLALPQGEVLGPDSAELVLAGTDKDGKISFKKFSEFGIKGPGPAPASFTVYQAGVDKVAGRVYQCQGSPFLQTYYKDSLIVAGGQERKNWALDNSQDSLYTYLNMVIEKGKIGISTDSVLGLDSIFKYLKGQSGLENVVDTFSTSGSRSREDSVLYFVNEGGKLYFTAPVAGSKDGWTFKKPTGFAWDKTTMYYGIKIAGDNSLLSAFHTVLTDLFGVPNGVFSPAQNETVKYFYHPDNGDWRPLYIKVVPSCAPQPYEYVDSKWLKDGDYDLGAALQLTADADGGITGSVAKDDAIIIGKARPDRAKFFFEFADSISGGTHKLSLPAADTLFTNEKTIELFYIKNGNKYLTVLDTTIFGNIEFADSAVTNTQLGWADKLKEDTVAKYRQAFAIVYNKKKDNIITLLPVASYKWKSVEGKGVSSYGKNLYYNKAIGAETANPCGVLFVDLSKAWYITQLSKTGADQPQRLIIADPTGPSYPSNEAIWFKTEMDLNTWDGPTCGDTIFAVYNVDGTKYYSAGSKDNKANGKLDDVTVADIRSHWYATSDKKPEKGKLVNWIFTPNVDTIYNAPQQRVLQEPRIALNLEDGKIELVHRTATQPYTRDTIQVVCIAVPDGPFLNIDGYANASKRVAILESLYKDRNISYLSLQGDTVVPRNTSTLEAFLKGVDSSEIKSFAWLDVRKSNVQKLGKYKPIEVPYYIFSHTYKGKQYFLRAGASKDSVQWVSLNDDQQTELLKSESLNTTLAPFKFCLPYVYNVDGTRDDKRAGTYNKVYLQTLDVGQQQTFDLVKAGNETGIVNAIDFFSALKSETGITKTEGIYAAVDQYKNNIQQISSWIILCEDGGASDWVRVDDAVDDIEEATSVGVLTNVDYLGPGAAYLAPSSETKDSIQTAGAVNYGVLTDVKERGANFTLEYKGVAQIGFNQDSIWYYNIYTTNEKGDSIYLTDAIDSATVTPNTKFQYIYPNIVGGTPFVYGFFAPTKLPDAEKYKEQVYADSLFRQTFGLKYTEPVEERKGFYFVIVSSADYTKKQSDYRYLGRAGNRLVFVSGQESALKFQWGKVTEDGYVGIKEVGAPAKIYGVSGGVKVANVSGAVSIYTIDGRLVTSKVAVSANQTIAVPAGIYIVKSGTDVAKVVVR